MNPTVWLFCLTFLSGALCAATGIAYLILESQRKRQFASERRFAGRIEELESKLASLHATVEENQAVAARPAGAKSRVETLQPTDRLTVMKHFRAGRTTEQIAPLVGLPLATVRFILDLNHLTGRPPHSPPSQASKEKLENAVVLAIQNTKIAREWRDAS